jgi:hypothetical protein
MFPLVCTSPKQRTVRWQTFRGSLVPLWHMRQGDLLRDTEGLRYVHTDVGLDLIACFCAVPIRRKDHGHCQVVELSLYKPRPGYIVCHFLTQLDRYLFRPRRKLKPPSIQIMENRKRRRKLPAFSKTWKKFLHVFLLDSLSPSRLVRFMTWLRTKESVSIAPISVSSPLCYISSLMARTQKKEKKKREREGRSVCEAHIQHNGYDNHPISGDGTPGKRKVLRALTKPCHP